MKKTFITENALSRLLEPRLEIAYTALRVGTGLMFAFHGVQKVFGVLTERAPQIGSQLWIGGVIELVCGTAIALGLFTRSAAFLASGTMAVAYVQFHWQLAFGAKFFPTINKGELALAYALLFLYFAARGGGRLSLDQKLGAPRAPRAETDRSALSSA